ncbi:MAG: BatD family protein [Flavisolibacter sp.]
MKYSFFILILLVLVNPLRAQVSVVSDRDSILIGEQFRLTVKGVFNQARPSSWMRLDSLPGFEIIEAGKPDTIQTQAGFSISQEFILTSWDSGTLKIPSLRIGRSITRPFNIEVGYTKLDPNKDYHDIKDIIPVQRPRESKWYWYLIFGLVLLGLFLLFFPKMKKAEPSREIPPEKAYEVAMKKLQRLESETGYDEKHFYTELVFIFREYLQRKKGIESHSKTTEDLVVPVQSLRLPEKQYKQLVASLQLSDMVKFARYQSQEQEKKEAFSSIRESIMNIEQNTHAV